ncbi:MAG: HprK-related kinase A [Gammaproteobacteria bacterium]
MKVSEVAEQQLRRYLRHGSLQLALGPFVYRVRSSIPEVARGIQLLYADYPIDPELAFSDFHVTLDTPRAFKPFPLDQAYALFEWGLNWCVSTYANHYLKIHAAVVERGGCAAILPAPPGSGKSTLCAGLVSRGWRLLSDELALVSLTDARIVPIPRPVSLKNESLDVIREFAPDAVFGPISADTHKGRVGHMKVPEASVGRHSEPARPAWIIFPQYKAGVPTALTPYSRARGFMRLAENAFNYNLLGARGFEALAAVMDSCECFECTYSDLGEAVALFDSLETSRTCS